MIKVEIKNQVAFIYFNRPEKSNSLNDEMVIALKNAIIELDKTTVKVVVFSGIGKSFCAGADLAYLQKISTYTLKENEQDSIALMNLFKMIHEMEFITIAAVNGPALAGGCGIVTVCDFAFSVPDATFGYTEARIGFIPAIVSVFLTAKIGEINTKRLLLSAEIMSAEKALSYQLISMIVENNLEDEVITFAQKLIVNNSFSSMIATKKLLNSYLEPNLTEQLLKASLENAKARNSIDCKKGIAAFLNKTKPDWN